ncbi:MULTISPECIES: conjugal transfer protein TraO [unclassified Serratia (in: enterobacteria)]|uniref:conjugal transfer protein TraO n=1 Tax=unclassified Serratia (in: enterobacteria) TaxID=2647522 RepID=UPI003075F6FF
MSTEKDVSRDVKKTGIVIGTVVFSVIAGGYLLVSWMNTPPPPASRINVDKAAGGSGKATPESPHYQEILRENNAEGAKQAQVANTSFIASVGSGTVLQVPPISPGTAPMQSSQPAPHVQYPPYAQSPQQGIDPDRKRALEAMLKELVTQRTAPAGQMANMTGMASGQPGGTPGSKPVSLYAEWAESLAPAVSHTALSNGVPDSIDHVVIPAGSRPGGVIDTSIDSDNTGSQVLASIPAGPYAGALLMANGVQLAGNGVSIHFTRMTWNKNTWRVDVWAAMPDTLQSSVASSVNNRYGSRILLPALAHGLGLGGQLYANANTQILSNGYNTLEGRVGMPDGTAVAGTVLGGAAQQAGQVIASDAQKLPVKQVLVDRGQSVALIFMTAVKESDKETRTPADTPSAEMRLQPTGLFTPAAHP